MLPSAHAATAAAMNHFEVNRFMQILPCRWEPHLTTVLYKPFMLQTVGQAITRVYANAFSTALPAYFACVPSCCSIRNN